MVLIARGLVDTIESCFTHNDLLYIWNLGCFIDYDRSDEICWENQNWEYYVDGEYNKNYSACEDNFLWIDMKIRMK